MLAGGGVGKQWGVGIRREVNPKARWRSRKAAGRQAVVCVWWWWRWCSVAVGRRLGAQQCVRAVRAWRGSRPRSSSSPSHPVPVRPCHAFPGVWVGWWRQLTNWLWLVGLGYNVELECPTVQTEVRNHNNTHKGWSMGMNNGKAGRKGVGWGKLGKARGPRCGWGGVGQLATHASCHASHMGHT